MAIVSNETPEKQPPLSEAPMTRPPEQFAMKDVPVVEVILDSNHDSKMENDHAVEIHALSKAADQP